jgi:acyl-CoA synthetase (NDP forming)
MVFVVDSEGGDPELAAQGASLRAEFGKGGIPAYPSVKRAARALIHLYRYYHRLNRINAPGLK